MKPLLIYLSLLIPVLGATQVWTAYAPFGDTLGVYSISLQNDNCAWFVGCRTDGHDLAKIARTTDGGASFNTADLPLQTPAYTVCITSTDEATAYVAALQNWGNSVTLKTLDGGQTWQDTHTPWDPVVSWPDYIHAFSPAKICQIGDPRNGEFEVYNSANGGISWTLVSPANIPDPLPGEFSFNNGGYALGNHIWFVTNRGRVYHSDNAGYNWSVVQTPSSALGVVAFSDPEHGLVNYFGNTSSSDSLLHTSDGGQTWQLIKLPIAETYHFYGVPAYLENSSIMVAGVYTDPQLYGKNQTWVSKDRGNTWTQVSDGEIIGWPVFNSPTNGWAGEWGPIIPTDHTTRAFKYKGSPLVGILSPNTLEADVRLSPNPATEFVELNVEVATPQSFRVLLNDAGGRLIRKYEMETTANISQKINLMNLPSGKYTLTISSEKGNVSKQFVKR